MFCLAMVSAISLIGQGADRYTIQVLVKGESKTALGGVTIVLLKKDSSIFKTAISDEKGQAVIEGVPAGKYICRLSLVSYTEKIVPLETGKQSIVDLQVVLEPAGKSLQEVTVVARKPFVQMLPDKTVVNVDAGITNTGSSIMEVLEKSPGITIDRDGNISMKGRSGVQVMIDGKLTMLSGSDLANLLNGLNASQVDQIELIDNPSAKYDAAGNAGLINIKTKKNKQKGFNGTLNLSAGQGRYPKTNNSLLVNLRQGKFNFTVNYSSNINQSVGDMYARRTYYTDATKTTTDHVLEQPFFSRSWGVGHTLRTGMDYYVNSRTTIGLAMNGTLLRRGSEGSNSARWIDQNGSTDSLIYTNSDNNMNFRNGAVNLNLRHNLGPSRDISADVDYIRYRIRSDQYFENHESSGNYQDANRGDIPSDLEIFSGKIDYSQKWKQLTWESGWKSSHVNTDNFAQYFYLDQQNWNPDWGRTNHFLYTENIHALYTSFAASKNKWEWQAGVRYEYTAYRANQLGNILVKDSSFTRNYHNLFPSLFLTWHADSASSFSFRAGRRIDRPPFQKLNPFSSIINKYTYQQGNPLILPQYTWNLEMSYLFRQLLNIGISYNYTNDYFSQIFYPSTNNGVSTIIYSDGNVGQVQIFGLTVGTQLSPTKWWSLGSQANFTHKKLKGTLWKLYSADISQFNVNINNQFRFRKGWAAELSGFYIGKSQNDLQEVLDPTGQVSAGFSKQILKNKGTLKFTFRDIFYTQVMAGLTHFETVNEYFSFKRDTRVATISFTYRFGKALKQTVKRSNGAEEEMNRVGNGN